MALFIVGGDFLVIKIICEITELKVYCSSLIKLSMKFGSLSYYAYYFALFCPGSSKRGARKAFFSIDRSP
jgi:hypothetical protein